MPFTDHLAELRLRLIRSAVAVLVGFLACFAFRVRLFDFLMRPIQAALGDTPMVTLGAADLFVAYLKVSFFAGLVLASPVVFFQIWKFIAPGLYAKERRMVVPFVAASTLFFATGAGFGYFAVMPYAFEFFVKLIEANAGVTAAFDIKQNLSFALRFLMVFGIVFEMPVLIFFLARVGIVDAPMLLRHARLVAVAAFILAAVLTPPDPFTQVLLAVPLVLLYLLSAGVAHLFGKPRGAPSDP